MKHRRNAVLLALALTCACAGERAEEAPLAEAGPPPAAAPAGPQLPALRVEPSFGKPGTAVTVTMGGLALAQSVELGFGTFGGHTILASGDADGSGTYSASVALPADAAPGTNYFFLAEQGSARPISAPAVFLVTGPSGTVQLTGRMTEGVECPAMLDDTQALYSLSGVDDVPEKDARVAVEGTPAEQSICQQGITIAVTSLKALP
jgi:hypothetical protein